MPNHTDRLAVVNPFQEHSLLVPNTTMRAASVSSIICPAGIQQYRAYSMGISPLLYFVLM